MRIIMFVFLLWIKEAIVGLFRNFWWNIAAFLLSFVCLIAFSVSYAAGGNAKHLSNELNQKLEIQVDVKEGYVNYAELKEKIEEDARVTEVLFVSKEDAENKFVGEMGKDATVLELFEENIFPAQFIVRVANVDQIEMVADYIGKMDFVDRVLFGKEYVNGLLQFTSQFNKIGFYGTIVFSIFVVFLITYVIQMNIEQRKDEIRIKQLIGSSMLTVRAPFVLESLFLVSAASVLAYFGFSYMYGEFLAFITKELPALSLLDASFMKDSLMYPLFGLALTLGIFGSFLATGRHLKRL